MQNKNKLFKRVFLLALFCNIALACFGNPTEPIISVQNDTAIISLWNTLIVTLGAVATVGIPAYFNRNKKQ